MPASLAASSGVVVKVVDMPRNPEFEDFFQSSFSHFLVGPGTQVIGCNFVCKGFVDLKRVCDD